MWESEFITPFNHKKLGYLPLAGLSRTAQRALCQLVELAFAKFTGEDNPAFTSQ